jgi:hypothetical protein
MEASGNASTALWGPNGWNRVEVFGEGAVGGQESHIAAPNGRPLCDRTSPTYDQAWKIATVADAVTCLHCRKAFGLVRP